LTLSSQASNFAAVYQRQGKSRAISDAFPLTAKRRPPIVRGTFKSDAFFAVGAVTTGVRVAGLGGVPLHLLFPNSLQGPLIGGPFALWMALLCASPAPPANVGREAAASHSFPARTRIREDLLATRDHTLVFLR
jgi:hypothetical protein